MAGSKQPKPDVSKRIGIAKGLWEGPDDFDRDNELIAKMFEDSRIWPDEEPDNSPERPREGGDPS